IDRRIVKTKQSIIIETNKTPSLNNYFILYERDDSHSIRFIFLAEWNENSCVYLIRKISFQLKYPFDTDCRDYGEEGLKSRENCYADCVKTHLKAVPFPFDHIA